jgi:hypothetical protein
MLFSISNLLVSLTDPSCHSCVQEPPHQPETTDTAPPWTRGETSSPSCPRSPASEACPVLASARRRRRRWGAARESRHRSRPPACWIEPRPRCRKSAGVAAVRGSGPRASRAIVPLPSPPCRLAGSSGAPVITKRQAGSPRNRLEVRKNLPNDFLPDDCAGSICLILTLVFLPSIYYSADVGNRMCVHPKFLHSNATSHKWPFGGKRLLGCRNFFLLPWETA